VLLYVLGFTFAFLQIMSSKSYIRHDRSKEVKVLAAQRCDFQLGLMHIEALKQETMELGRR
jgi:hypothetical protein